MCGVGEGRRALRLRGEVAGGSEREAGERTPFVLRGGSVCGARVVLRRARRGPVAVQPDVPGPERHHVRRVHRQQLLRPSKGRAARGALPAPVRRRAHGQLPDFPTTTTTHPFNYSGTPPNNTFVTHGTSVVPRKFNCNTSAEMVLKGTSIQGAESQPLHMHGFNFFVVG
ncbi:hypothetical protein ABZP36_017210 [Zizania latifolia]